MISILLSSSAGTGGILFGVTLLLCALLVFTIRGIDIKTRVKTKEPPAKEKKKNEEGDGVNYYIVKKKKKHKAKESA